MIKKETDADAIRSGKKVLAVKARGVSKAEAIKKLAQKLGILIKDIIAFGDEVNDIEMLTLVGLGIAMENADDVVKEAADQIAGRRRKRIRENIWKCRKVRKELRRCLMN